MHHAHDAALQDAKVTAASLLCHKYVRTHSHLSVAFLQGKRLKRGKKLTKVDNATMRVLIGELDLKQVTRHWTSVGAVMMRIKRLQHWDMHTCVGKKPSVPIEVETLLVAYVNMHSDANMCRLPEEAWDEAEALAAAAGIVGWRATRGWWRRFRERHENCGDSNV